MIEKDTANQPILNTQTSTNPPEVSYTATSSRSNNMMWVIPLICIVILLAIAGAAYAGYSFIKNNADIADKIVPQDDDSEVAYETEMRGTIPSSCGYSIGWPTTVDQSTQKQWVYEEIPVWTESFYGFGPNSIAKNGVLMATTFFKTDEEKFNPKNEKYDFNWPGLVSYCTPNTDNWTLAEFVEHAVDSSNDSQAITASPTTEMWGQLEVHGVNMTGISDGMYVNQPFYLAVVPTESKFSRLVIFQPWSSEDTVLETDAIALQQSLAPREVTEQLVVKSRTPANTTTTSTSTTTTTKKSCTDFPIREGVFASNKCYTDKDLADLQYYLARYNSAIFDINSAARSSEITCSGSEFFKDECEQDKAQHAQGVKDEAQYKATIEGIIAKGK